MNRNRAALMLLISILCAGATFGADDVRDCCGAIFDRLYPPELMGIGNDMPRLAGQATFLFVGKVVKAESVPCCDNLVEVTLRASKVWKGLEVSTVVVHTGEAAKRPFPFAIGQEYLVATLGSQDTKGRYGLHPGFRPVERSSATGMIDALDEWRRKQHDAGISK